MDLNWSGPAALWGVKGLEQLFNAIHRNLYVRHWTVWVGWVGILSCGPGRSALEVSAELGN